MSDTSNSSSRKRRLEQIDDTIEQLSQEVNSLNDFVYKTELECSLMTIKMKREKLVALSAIAKAQVIMADMKAFVAKKELILDVERLKQFTKMRLDSEEGGSQKHDCKVPTPPSTATKSIETSRGTSEKEKYRKHSSSRKSPVDKSSSRTPLHDISSDDTIIIPSIFEITQTKETAKSPAKKQKSEKKGDSKSKLKSSSHKANSISSKQCQRSPKMVVKVQKAAETSSKQSGSSSHLIYSPTSRQEDKTSTVSTTWHVPQPSTSAMSQAVYSNSQKEGNNQRFNFYGCLQQ